jgi:hypothetical protein
VTFFKGKKKDMQDCKAAALCACTWKGNKIHQNLTVPKEENIILGHP